MSQGLAERVVARFLRSRGFTGAGELVSPDYIERLLKAPGVSGNAPEAYLRLQQLARSLSNDAIAPFPVAELWSYLEGRGVPQDEVDLLKSVRVRPSGKRKTVSFTDAFIEFGRETGTSVVPDMRFENDEKAAKAVLGWLAGWKRLKPKARKVWDRMVKKVHLGAASGSEDASWRTGGVLHLTVTKDYDLKIRGSQLTHELGHAFEEMHGVSGAPWGSPPFVSDYAEFKPGIEDVAESFRAYIEEPAVLRSKCPEKYEAMRKLVG